MRSDASHNLYARGAMMITQSRFNIVRMILILVFLFSNALPVSHAQTDEEIRIEPGDASALSGKCFPSLKSFLEKYAGIDLYEGFDFNKEKYVTKEERERIIKTIIKNKTYFSVLDGDGIDWWILRKTEKTKEVCFIFSVPRTKYTDWNWYMNDSGNLVQIIRTDTEISSVHFVEHVVSANITIFKVDSKGVLVPVMCSQSFYDMDNIRIPCHPQNTESSVSEQQSENNIEAISDVWKTDKNSDWYGIPVGQCFTSIDDYYKSAWWLAEVVNKGNYTNTNELQSQPDGDIYIMTTLVTFDGNLTTDGSKPFAQYLSKDSRNNLCLRLHAPLRNSIWSYKHDDTGKLTNFSTSTSSTPIPAFVSNEPDTEITYKPDAQGIFVPACNKIFHDGKKLSIPCIKPFDWPVFQEGSQPRSDTAWKTEKGSFWQGIPLGQCFPSLKDYFAQSFWGAGYEKTGKHYIRNHGQYISVSTPDGGRVSDLQMNPIREILRKSKDSKKLCLVLHAPRADIPLMESAFKPELAMIRTKDFVDFIPDKPNGAYMTEVLYQSSKEGIFEPTRCTRHYLAENKIERIPCEKAFDMDPVAYRKSKLPKKIHAK